MFKILLAMAAFAPVTLPAAYARAPAAQGAQLEAKAAEAAMGREWKLTRMVMERRDRDNPGYRGHFSDALHKSQRNWRSFRTEHCEVEAADPEGGPLRTANRFLCFADLARKRAAELAHLRREG